MTKWIFGSVCVLFLATATVPAAAQAPDPAAQPTEELSTDQILANIRTTLMAFEEGNEDVEALKQASTSLERILLEDPSLPYANFLQGWMELRSGRPYDALPKIRDYSRNEGSNDEMAFRLLGEINMSGGYFKLARPQLIEAAELSPRSAKVWTMLARCEASLGDFKNAVEHVDRALELQQGKNASMQYLAKAEIAYQQANFQLKRNQNVDLDTLREGDESLVLAIEAKRKQIAEDPGNVDFLEDLNGQLAFRIQLQNFLLQFDPKKPEPYLVITETMMMQSRLSRLLFRHQALGLISRGIELMGENPDPGLLSKKAELEFGVGQDEAAAATLDQLLKIQPENAWARDMKKRLSGTKRNDPEKPSQPVEESKQ